MMRQTLSGREMLYVSRFIGRLLNRPSRTDGSRRLNRLFSTGIRLQLRNTCDLWTILRGQRPREPDRGGILIGVVAVHMD